jgi:hypothetical protein
MRFRHAIWYPLAAVLAAGNIAAVWFAAAGGEPLHATVHAAGALAFGLWAQRLRAHRRGSQLSSELEPLALEIDQLRVELEEARERLDFTQRVLAQEVEPRRPEREP